MVLDEVVDLCLTTVRYLTSIFNQQDIGQFSARFTLPEAPEVSLTEVKLTKARLAEERASPHSSRHAHSGWFPTLKG